MTGAITWPVAYAILAIESAAIAIAATPLAARLGLKMGLVDVPGGRKAHRRPTPCSGGIALFLVFWLVVWGNLAGAALILAQSKDAPIAPFAGNVVKVLPQLGAIFLGSFWIFAVGLADDRWGLRPSLKLACQLTAALPLLLADIHIVSFIPWPWMGKLLTALWVVFVINAFNFLDNMDGLSAGVGAIGTGVLAWISFGSGEWFMTAMFVVLTGTLLGFLRHNFNPASVFMGDSGSMFLGFMIATLTVLATYYKQGVPTKLPVLTPLIVLGVPIFDTCSVLWIRWREGKPLTRGDRNHFSHRLVNLGMSERGAVAFIYLTSLCVALGALPLRYLNLTGALIVAFQTALWFVIIYWIERLGKRAVENNRE